MTNPSELTDFQKKILTILYQQPDYGLGLKRTLQDYYQEDLPHSRVYINLDTLTDHGLVEKQLVDGRTNEYVITRSGQAVVEAEVDWMREKMERGQ